MEHVPASLGLRFVNYLIDQVVIGVLGFGIGFVLAIVGQADVIEQIPGFVLGVFLGLLYYVPMEFLTGRTLGKFVTGTKIVSTSTGKPSLGQILGRTLCRFIPFEPLSLLFRDGIGWHDSIPSTLVVKIQRDAIPNQY